MCVSGDVQSSTAFLWWSISWTVKERPASTRRPSKETPPGTVCPPAASLFPADPPPRVPIACRASRSSRPPSHAAPLSTGSCQMDPGMTSVSAPQWTHLFLLKSEVCVSQFGLLHILHDLHLQSCSERSLHEHFTISFGKAIFALITLSFDLHFIRLN